MEPKQQVSLTGRARRRTRPFVKWTDRIARIVIAAGGIGTIVMVSLVCLFLLWVVVPLFKSARIEREPAIATPLEAAPRIKVGIDEYRLMGWSLSSDGKLRVFRLIDGREIGPGTEIKGAGSGDAARMTAWSFGVDGEHCAFGFADGSVRTGIVGFKTTYLKRSELSDAVRKLSVGESIEHDGGMVTRIAGDQYRQQKISVELDPSTPPVSASPIVQISFAIRTEGPIVCTRSADGSVNVNSVKKQVNLISDETTLTVDSAALPAVKDQPGAPGYLLISGLGDSVVLAWHDGTLIRFDTRDLSKPREAERKRLLTEPGQTLTALQYMIGGATLVAGDSSGQIRAWSGAKPKDADTPDGIVLVSAHEFPAEGSPVTSLAVSSRDRTVAAGYEDGAVRLLYMTSGRILGETTVGDKGARSAAISSLAMAPRGDALIGASSGGLAVWNVDTGYPEITLATLFRPVWYEGYAGPSYSWQSSSGSDAFEPKFGLMPLIFGTLKATFYSMLFGAPLALLAALYTSEFLHPRLRARIKPIVELMASLPSVVLGFLAGLVIAPAAESVVPVILAAFITIPFVLLLAAHLWQLLPVNSAVRLRPGGFRRRFSHCPRELDWPLSPDRSPNS